ncbi:MAG TPA: hypothetical protein VGL40_08010 [Bacillota bacterium]|jgi:hypothetical protein
MVKLSEDKLAEYAQRTKDGETMEAALKRGLPLKDVSTRFKVAQMTVIQVRRFLGIPGNPSGGAGKKRAAAARQGAMAAIMGVEPPVTVQASAPEPVNRRALGGMVARSVAQQPPSQPAAPPPAPVPAPGPAPAVPVRPADSTWKFSIKRRMPAAALHKKLQPLTALLSETDGDVQVDIYVADVPASAS